MLTFAPFPAVAVDGDATTDVVAEQGEQVSV